MLSIRAIVALAAAIAVSGCAYKPLKAPCSADEGGPPSAYSSLQQSQQPAEPSPAGDQCGPMRPI